LDLAGKDFKSLLAVFFFSNQFQNKGNNLGLEGSLILGEALKINSSLRHLNLSGKDSKSSIELFSKHLKKKKTTKQKRNWNWTRWRNCNCRGPDNQLFHSALGPVRYNSFCIFSSNTKTHNTKSKTMTLAKKEARQLQRH
jgi:hypothetical protein